MKLKGTAKIILRDAKTGKIVQEEAHSNTITPALASIFNNNIAGTLDFAKVTPILNRLLGGVCLWRGNLYPNDIFLPKQTNARLTAHAGSDTSAGLDPTKGVLNVGQGATGPIPNGYKWVWDWAANAGNGSINALTLVHEDVGNHYNQNRTGSMAFAPVEDVSNYIINANDFIPSGNQALTVPAFVGTPDQHKIPIGFYGDKNKVVSFRLEEKDISGDVRSGSIHIYISKFTGTDLWLKNSIADVDIERELEFSIPWQSGEQDWIGRAAFYIAYDETNKHLYLLYCWDSTNTVPIHGIKYNHVITIHDIDLETGTKTERTATTWPQGPYAHMSYYAPRSVEEYYDPLQLQVVNGCVFMPVYYVEGYVPHEPTPEDPDPYDWKTALLTSNLGVRINLRTGDVEDWYDGVPLLDYHENNALGINAHINLGNERTMGPGVMLERLATGESKYQKLFNFYAEEVTRETSVFGTDGRYNRTYFANSSDSLIMYATRCTASGVGDNLRGAVLNKMYQASVFNLAAPVAKTSANTMSVEYSITQVQEDET